MNILEKIGGTNGDVQGDAVIQPVYHAIIGPTFSASISWSGRAAKGKERKIALQKYGKIVRIIGLICNKADYQYTAEMCNRDLKYKIIKYCQSRYGECESDIK